MILDLDRAEALHLAVALDLHRQTCRTNGVPLSAELDQLGAWCWRRAKGDSEGQAGPTLAEIAAPLVTFENEEVASKRVAIIDAGNTRKIVEGAAQQAQVGLAVQPEVLRSAPECLSAPRRMREGGSNR